MTGTGGAGSACEDDVECKSNDCNEPDCGSACCVGTCVGDALPAPADAGSACVTSLSCKPGLYCAPGPDTSTCKPIVGPGSDCDGADFGCGSGFACSSADVCAPLPATGKPCPDSRCANIGDVCGSDGTCHLVGLAGDVHVVR